MDARISRSRCPQVSDLSSWLVDSHFLSMSSHSFFSVHAQGGGREKKEVGSEEGSGEGREEWWESKGGEREGETKRDRERSSISSFFLKRPYSYQIRVPPLGPH